jgi:hypothetical protein
VNIVLHNTLFDETMDEEVVEPKVTITASEFDAAWKRFIEGVFAGTSEQFSQMDRILCDDLKKELGLLKRD